MSLDASLTHDLLSVPPLGGKESVCNVPWQLATALAVTSASVLKFSIAALQLILLLIKLELQDRHVFAVPEHPKITVTNPPL